MLDSALILLSYPLLALFAVAIAMKARKMARLPVHLRWELSPVPHEKGRSDYGGSYLEELDWWTKPREKSLVTEAVYMFKEIVFLKGVWEHNRRLWWFSFPFHFGLYLLIAAAPLLLLAAILELTGTGAPDLLASAIPVLGGAGFVLGGLGTLGLLAMRLTTSKLKPYTTPVGLFNLVLLLALFATGAWALSAVDDFGARMEAFTAALVTADLSVDVPGILAAHLALALVFLAYLPFSQMLHFVAKYFTYHQIRWEDEPVVAGGRLEKEALGLLGQSPTWSAPHVGSDGNKTWVDIATGEKEQ